MGLKKECLEYKDELVLIHPVYGWGWGRYDKEYKGKSLIDYKEIDEAGSFHVRIKDFFRHHDDLRGFTGIVEEKNHKFDNFWIVSVEMHVGEWDFKENLCWRYDLEIGQRPPEGEWPRINKGSPLYFGHAIVAESQEWIDKFHKKENNLRKRDIQ